MRLKLLESVVPGRLSYSCLPGTEEERGQLSLGPDFFLSFGDPKETGLKSNLQGVTEVFVASRSRYQVGRGLEARAW